jgi:hypothetical protein
VIQGYLEVLYIYRERLNHEDEKKGRERSHLEGRGTLELLYRKQTKTLGTQECRTLGMQDIRTWSEGMTWRCKLERKHIGQQAVQKTEAG